MADVRHRATIGSSFRFLLRGLGLIAAFAALFALVGPVLWFAQ